MLKHEADSYIAMEKYENALELLEQLRKMDCENPVYYKEIAVCNAQLGRGRETVLILGQAAQLFGEKMVLNIIQDPDLDPVREDRIFQSFTDRVGGKEFRMWLEKMAKNMEMGKRDGMKDATLKLKVDDNPISARDLQLKQ
jgi:tetratricopeptide (TPR) repeat protein